MLEPCLLQPCFHVAGNSGGARNGGDRVNRLVLVNSVQIIITSKICTSINHYFAVKYIVNSRRARII